MEHIFGSETLQMIFIAGTIYGAIRADLKYVKYRADEAYTMAKEAHTRLNDHFERRKIANE